MNNTKEARIVELRAKDDEKMVIEGYAVVFDSLTDLGYCREIISRDALLY